MNKLAILSIKVLILCSVSFSGLSQRYLTDNFPLLDSIKGGIYGTALDYQSNTQNLLFDFYEPANDPLTKRPLIIYIHGGGFTTGSRSYPSVSIICRRMANKGYAVANIDYRLEPGFDIYNSGTNRRAMTDAMHDAKQAIRYFKANASVYGIDTSYIFIGGESAGAATAMMASFVNKQSEMASYPMANPNNPIGSSSNSSFGNNVSATLCLCGLMLDTLAIEFSSDPPILWTHGTNDSYVPISFANNIVQRANNVGLPIQTKIYQGGVHCPWYFGNPNWATYLDSTITDITSFLYPFLNPLSIENRDNLHSLVTVYPNPFYSNISVHIQNNEFKTRVKLLSNTGSIILDNHYQKTELNFNLSLDNLESGVYFLWIENKFGKTIKKIVKI